MPPLPYLPSPSPPLATRTAALESSEAVLITREITRHFQPGNTVQHQRRWLHCGPSYSHDSKRGCCKHTVQEDPERHLAILPEIGGIKGTVLLLIFASGRA
jgi:hypothetical protein